MAKGSEDGLRPSLRVVSAFNHPNRAFKHYTVITALEAPCPGHQLRFGTLPQVIALSPWQVAPSLDTSISFFVSVSRPPYCLRILPKTSALHVAKKSKRQTSFRLWRRLLGPAKSGGAHTNTRAPIWIVKPVCGFVNQGATSPYPHPAH